jgi:hypothetical protein
MRWRCDPGERATIGAEATDVNDISRQGFPCFPQQKYAGSIAVGFRQR